MGWLISIIAYVIAKFFVYRFVAQEINKRLNEKVNPTRFAFVRLAIGFIIGSGYLLIAASFVHSSTIILYGIFLIVRFFEWVIAITYFYDRKTKFAARTVKFSAIATLLSFSVDIAGIITGKVLGGGVC